MKNFVQEGDSVQVPAPSGGTVGGVGVLIAFLFGVAGQTATVGNPVEIFIEGVYDLAKATGAITLGAKLYWDDTAKVVTTTASGNTLIGVATQAQVSGDATARVRLNGQVP